MVGLLVGLFGALARCLQHQSGTERDVRQCNKHHPMQIPHAITCGKVTGVQTTHKEVKTALVHVIRRCRAKTNLAEPLLKQYIGPYNPDASVQPVSDHTADHVPAEHSVLEPALNIPSPQTRTT